MLVLVPGTRHGTHTKTVHRYIEVHVFAGIEQLDAQLNPYFIESAVVMATVDTDALFCPPATSLCMSVSLLLMYARLSLYTCISLSSPETLHVP